MAKERAKERAGERDEARRAAPLPAATFHILLALGDGPRHGYAIMREVEELSDGAVTMGPGTLYGSIKRMLADGLIDEVDERPDPELDDQRRRYYALTATGELARDSEIDRVRGLLDRAGRRSVRRLAPGTA